MSGVAGNVRTDRSVAWRLCAALSMAAMVASMVVAWWAWRSEKSARDERAAVGLLCDELERRLQRADAHLATGAGKTGEAAGVVDEAFQRRVVAEIEDAEKTSAARSLQFFERMENDPDFQNRYVAQQRAYRLEMCRPFFRAMKLSPEQINRLGDAWAEAMMTDFDLRAIGKTGDHAVKGREVSELQRQATAAKRVAEEAVLGVDGIAKMRRWEKTLAVRSVVTAHFAGKAALAGVPVTLDNVEELVEILAEADSGFRKTGDLVFRNINWRAASAAARQLLTAEQHALFAAEVEKQRASEEFRRELLRAQAEEREKQR